MVCLRLDFDGCFRHCLTGVATQLGDALVHGGLEGVVEPNEVIVVERALIFDVGALRVGGGPGPMVVLIVRR